MNRKGQAMIEALISGVICILGLCFVFICGIKIIQSTIRDEKIEEQYIRQHKF